MIDRCVSCGGPIRTDGAAAGIDRCARCEPTDIVRAPTVADIDMFRRWARGEDAALRWVGRRCLTMWGLPPC